MQIILAALINMQMIFCARQRFVMAVVDGQKAWRHFERQKFLNVIFELALVAILQYGC